ncbi:NADPH-dependent FMN reductase [Mucilaginibacter sp. L196]|uniref:NADPH-dependent FMN reductase n=1 Tax=Mucilaginibacter sp. L196 TaxID=1641870 RepID=UPI00131B09F2|nr:NADPH-dependent FMN reductase [Mucilaginibacter sp. L196]
MSEIILISGSPVERSKSHAILLYAEKYFRENNLSTHLVSVRDFPAEDLLHGKYDSGDFLPFKESLAAAKGVLLATPIYKGAYSGALKALLDILPQYALKDKTVFPIATAGSMAHLLAIDFVIKPVLSVLGASDILQGVYITDLHFAHADDNGFVLEAELQSRLEKALYLFIQKVGSAEYTTANDTGLTAS